jgi:hypothetical protein
MPKDKSQFGFRYMRPHLDLETELSTFSGVYDFSANIPLSEKLNIIGSIPYVAYTFENSETENGLGNLFIGLQMHNGSKEKTSSVGTFGISLPTAAEDIYLFGSITDRYTGFKYWSELLTIYGNYAYHNLSSNVLKVGFEIGPNLMIPIKKTGKFKNSNVELVIHYGLIAGFQGKSIAIFNELVGLAVITEDYDEFTDRFVHSINFGAVYISKIVSPGVFYKLYLKEDLRELVDGVLGITVDVTIN